VEGVQAPVERAVARALRRAVVDHAGSQPGRTHAPALRVGVPGERVVHLDLAGDVAAAGCLDRGLAVDVVAAMCARALRARPGEQVLWTHACRAGAHRADLADQDDDLDYDGVPASAGDGVAVAQVAPLVWLTRRGDPVVLQDVDARWLAAARAAYAEAGVPLTFVVVGRRGWHDPRSGTGRTWVRLRQPAR
jgi:hypothetical protein